MALDLFQVTDKSQFWNVFGTASAVTYILAAMGLLAIYRKGLLDWLRVGIQAIFGTHVAPPGLRKTTFLERERKQRLKENIGWMQRARSRRAPVRRSTFNDSLPGVKPGRESLAARGQHLKEPRHSQATAISQALWLSDEDIKQLEPRVLDTSSRFKGRDTVSSPTVQVTGPPEIKRASRQDTGPPSSFTTGLAEELRNL